MNILYTGWYGFHNAGDDSFVYITDWKLKEIFPTDNIQCLSPHEYGNDVKSVFLSRKMSFKSLILSLLWYIPKTDLLLFSGGTLFKDSYKNNLYLQIITVLCKIWNVKIASIGVSLGPFSNLKYDSEWDDFFSNMELICVRDKSSYEWAFARGLNKCFLCFDLACLMPKYMRLHGYTNDVSKEDSIGISLCSYANELMQKDIMKALESFFQIKKRCQVVYLFIYKTGEDGDMKISIEFKEYLITIGYECYIVDYYSPFLTIQEMTKCKFMICTRLHAGIFSYAFNLPFILFEYEQKCSDFLSEIGMGDEMRIINISSESLENVYKAVLDKKNNSYSIADMQIKAEKNFELLKNITDFDE